MENAYVIVNGELRHWGIKGMKWGRRRYQNKDGSLTPEGKKRYGDGESGESETKAPKEVGRKTDRRPAKKMSNEELKEKIDRLELEKSYNKLMNENDTVTKGKRFVEGILTKSVENIGTQLTSYLIGVGVNKAAKSLGVKNATKTVKNDAGVEEIVQVFEDIVNPRKGQKDK